MNSIYENKFKAISIKKIEKIINSLYEPYKVYGDLETLLNKLPKYITPTKDYKGQLKCWKKGNPSFVIMNPKETEIEKIKAFREIEYLKNKLIELRNLQNNFTSKNLTKKNADKIEIDIENTLNEIRTSHTVIKNQNALKHYLRTKRFGFGFLRTYETNQYENFKNSLESLQQEYTYIFNNISTDAKIEFHNDFSDQLNNLLKKQNFTKFKELINDFKTEIDTNYKQLKNKIQPQQKDKKEIITQKKYLIDLFETIELYDKAIKILIEKGFISKNGNSLKWIFTPTNEYTTNQTVIALIVVLEKKQYLKQNLKAVYKNIENEFNIKIDKGTYSRSANGFKKDYDTTTPNTNKSYIDLFKDDL